MVFEDTLFRRRRYCCATAALYPGVCSGGGGDSGRQQQDDTGSGGSAEQTEFAFRLHLYKAKVLLLQEQVGQNHPDSEERKAYSAVAHKWSLLCKAGFSMAGRVPCPVRRRRHPVAPLVPACVTPDWHFSNSVQDVFPCSLARWGGPHVRDCTKGKSPLASRAI